jgi:hypothetical protein
MRTATTAAPAPIVTATALLALDRVIATRIVTMNTAMSPTTRTTSQARPNAPPHRASPLELTRPST